MGITRSVIQKSRAMGTQNDIQEAMKLTQRELQVLPGAPAVETIDEVTPNLEMTSAPSVSVIDFFAARDWLRAGFKERGQIFEIKRTPGKLASHRIPSLEGVDRLEESLYWLLSAATLLYFLLGIIAG
jgi:hypothetical protein